MASAGSLPHWIHRLVDPNMPTHEGHRANPFPTCALNFEMPEKPIYQTRAWTFTSRIQSTFNMFSYSIKQSCLYRLLYYLHTASKDKAERREGRLQTVLPWAQHYSRVTAQTPLPNSQLRHMGLWKEKGFKKHSWMSYQICSQGSLMLKLFLFKFVSYTLSQLWSGRGCGEEIQLHLYSHKRSASLKCSALWNYE